ncbi:MAG: hypothetical protein ACI9W6_001138 [Motiliproteus sp.]|jgi:hypothetical protein
MSKIKNSLIWVLLMTLTVLSFFLTESSSLPWVVAVILSITAVKGSFIIDGFMELNGVNHVIRTGMLLYCPVVCSLILYILIR